MAIQQGRTKGGSKQQVASLYGFTKFARGGGGKLLTSAAVYNIPQSDKKYLLGLLKLLLVVIILIRLVVT